MADPTLAFGWGVPLVRAPGSVPEHGIFVDTDNEPANSIWGNSPILAALCSPEKHFVAGDDFFGKNDQTNEYALVADAGGAVDTIDGAGGILSNATDGDDNDESYLSTLREIALFADAKALFFEARVKLAEAATDDSNIILGLSDTVGANTLLDDGGGPAASYDGAVWFKVDGGTVWQFETSNAGTQVTTASAGAFTTDTWTVLGFHFDGTATTGVITPYFNGTAGTAHSITNAGLAEMHVLLGAKAGGANAETLLVDYWKLLAVR